MKFKYFSLIFLLFFIIQMTAQVKNEREFRIELASFPEKAQQTLKFIPKEAKRVRFYKEEDGDKSSFESKFKYDGDWYSVEFNTEGFLEDVEVKVRKSKIGDDLLDTIEGYLNNHFKKFDYVKIQQQFLQDMKASDEDFLVSVTSRTNPSPPNWEIVMMVKVDKTYEIQELTFDSKGTFINSRTLEPTSYENIMF